MTGLGISTAASETTRDQNGPAGGIAAPVQGKASKPTTIREFERALRTLGYSQREAAGIALHGFKATDNTVESITSAELSELAALIARNQSILKD